MSAGGRADMGPRKMRPASRRYRWDDTDAARERAQLRRARRAERRELAARVPQ